jgi:hypothetical protein
MKNQEIQKPENNKQEPQRQEFQRRNTNSTNNYNQGPRNPREANQNREKESSSSHNRDNTQTRDNNQSRDNTQNRGFQRENQPRQNYSYQNSQIKFNTRVKTVETVEDIKADIARIEKEIELEIKEIKTMRLGL